jgi:hypothetical protein
LEVAQQSKLSRDCAIQIILKEVQRLFDSDDVHT